MSTNSKKLDAILANQGLLAGMLECIAINLFREDRRKEISEAAELIRDNYRQYKGDSDV